MKKALVTGGAGFIGSYIVEALLSSQWRVDCVDNLSTSRFSNLKDVIGNQRFRFFRGSITDRPLMRRLVQNCDIVYHMAAAVGVAHILKHPLESILTNVKGTETVLEFAAQYHKKIILASTSEVYGKHIYVPLKEDDDRIVGSTNKSRWGYAETKAIDEFLALAYHKEKKLKVVVLRFFNIVGPRQVGSYGMVLPRFLKQALRGKPITVYGDGTQLRCFAHVKDAVRAALAVSSMKKAEGEIFNVGSDEIVSIKQLALKIKQKTNSCSPICFVTYEKAFGRYAKDFEEINCRIPDLSKIKKYIGYRPYHTLDMIIDEAAECFRGQQ